MSRHQYAVICTFCGVQPLTEANYIAQLERPDSFWKCPKCGDSAEWDDDCLETNPEEDEDE